MMFNSIIEISMRAKNYDPLEGESTPKGPSLTSQPNGSLTFDKISFKPPSHPSKGAVHPIMHNLNSWAAQHYSIIEDLTQGPCSMSSLEVLQSFPMKWKDLFKP